MTQEDAKFSLKLHLIYLMNDVLHHCARKGADALQQSFESVAVEMYCSAWTSLASLPTEEERAAKRPKLNKLIKLWEGKKIFGSSTLHKMRQPEEAWAAYKAQIEETYSAAVDAATAQVRKLKTL